MDEKIIWVGNRESEIMYSTLFYKSITIYGSNKGTNISFNKTSYKSITNFLVETINVELKQGPLKLFFYSDKIAEQLLARAPHLKEYIINKYDIEFLKFIENKTYAHLWASNIMPIIEFTELFGSECNYKQISQKFKSSDKFIVQENYSSGGTGTFLLTKENEKAITSKLCNHKCYKISPYYERAYSVNAHIIITNDYISVLSPSIQLIENVNNRLLYKGADFISYENVPSEVKASILQYAKKMGKSLYNIGYTGVCGLDLLVSDGIVYFMEINPRFQASSILINRALKDNNLPDLQTIIYNIHCGNGLSDLLRKIETIKINYCTLSFYQNDDHQYNNFLIRMLEKSSKHIETIIIENENSTIVDEYMFRVIFNTNISSLNFDGSLFIYQNLLNYSKYTYELYKTDINALKCALLTQGIIIHENVKNYYDNKQIIKKATFDAIDISINEEFIINCPVNTKFVEISPFSIRKKDEFIGLFYLDNLLFKVSIFLQEFLPIKHTKNNINIHRIGFLTTDRLRIKHTSTCQFKRENNGCKFCHITSKFLDTIPLEDIYETIDNYTKFVNFRHFLIGGPSNTYDNESYYISNIIKSFSSIRRSLEIKFKSIRGRKHKEHVDNWVRFKRFFFRGSRLFVSNWSHTNDFTI